MADKKISQFALLAQADIDTANDVLAIVDATGPTTKKSTAQAIVAASAEAGLTNVQVTNVKAKDGTAAITISDSSGNVGLSANLNFSGTGQRITGDMSNATVANRLMFQGSVSNATTFVGLIPNGTGTTSSVNCFGNSDPTNAPFIRLLQNSTNDSQIRSDITGTGTYVPMTFHTNGSERMRLDTSGNLLIGNTTPIQSERLHIKGATLGGTTGDTSYNTVFYTPDVTNTTRLSVLDYRVSNGTSHISSRNVIQRRVDGTNMGFVGFDSNYTSIGWDTTVAVAVDSSGNVGIGTASPSYRLQVSGTAVGSAIWANVTNTDSTTAGSTAGFFGNNGAVNTVLYAAGQALVGVTGTTTNHPFLLFTNGSERMRIDSSGNVGIGTANPGDRLDVVGGNIRIASGNTVRWVDAGNVRASIEGNSSSNAIFSTAGSERMRITSTGNVVAGGSVALATTATDGFLYVPTCAGTPTGTPTAITGMAPIVVDTTNNKLYFYSTGVWRDAGP